MSMDNINLKRKLKLNLFIAPLRNLGSFLLDKAELDRLGFLFAEFEVIFIIKPSQPAHWTSNHA